MTPLKEYALGTKPSRAVSSATATIVLMTVSTLVLSGILLVYQPVRHAGPATGFLHTTLSYGIISIPLAIVFVLLASLFVLGGADRMRIPDPEKRRQKLERQKQEIEGSLNRIRYDLWNVHSKIENKKGELRRELDSWDARSGKVTGNRERKTISKFEKPIRELETKEAALNDEKHSREQELAKVNEEIRKLEGLIDKLKAELEERKRRIRKGLGIDTNNVDLSEPLHTTQLGSISQTATVFEPGPSTRPRPTQSQQAHPEVQAWGVEAFRAILANEDRREQLFTYLKEYAKERMSERDFDVARRIEGLAEWVKKQRIEDKIIQQREDVSKCAFCGAIFERQDGSSDERALARHLADNHSNEFPV